MCHGNLDDAAEALQYHAHCHNECVVSADVLVVWMQRDSETHLQQQLRALQEDCPVLDTQKADCSGNDVALAFVMPKACQNASKHVSMLASSALPYCVCDTAAAAMLTVLLMAQASTSLANLAVLRDKEVQAQDAVTQLVF